MALTDPQVPHDDSEPPSRDPADARDMPEVPPPPIPVGRGEPRGPGLLFTFHEDFTLERMFTPREADLVRRLTRFAREGAGSVGAQLETALDEGYRRLGAIALAMESYPALGKRTHLANMARSRESLVHALERGGGHAIEWALPTKAILSRTFGIAKANFWTSIKYVLAPLERGTTRPFRVAIEEAIEEAVYTRLAEELYGSFAASASTSHDLKRVAVDHVIDIWEGRVRFATYKFCPILRSAWHARQRAPRVFGTMMGANELFQLLFQDCDERFSDVFTEGDADPEMLQAFEEFLFDLPYESLERVRERMTAAQKDIVGPEEVAAILGYRSLRPKLAGAKDLYSSFRRRRVKAQYRTSMNAPGPRRAAESYVLEALLTAEARALAEEDPSAADPAGAERDPADRGED